MGLGPLSETQFPGEVRDFIRDRAELNRLISGEESSNRMVLYCTYLAIDEWNITPPLLGNITEISAFPSRFILLYLTVIHLLISVGILKSRNRFDYNDGGFSVRTEQQDALYQQWISLIRAQVNPLIARYKIAKNIEGGWGGGVGSEYGWIHGWYGVY